MRSLIATLAVFLVSALFLGYPLKNATGEDEMSFSKQKLEIEVKVNAQEDLLFLNEIGLPCSKLGRCICLADSSQVVSLAKAHYQFRPTNKPPTVEQREIRQSPIFQVKLETRNQAEINLVKSLGLECEDIGECITEANVEQMSELKKNSISFMGIREGIRVEGTSLALKPTGSAYGENNTAYYVPYFEWTYSPITISSAPYGATVNELEVTYNVYDPDGHTDYMLVVLFNENESNDHMLWYGEGTGGYTISETEKDSGDFLGETVNQTLKLGVLDSYPSGTATINSWRITIWFSGPPVYKANYTDYSIPDADGRDSVCSTITINTAPSIARVSSMDVQYDIIHPYVGDLRVWLNDFDHSAEYLLRNFYGGANADIHDTVTGITTFNGELVNQTWKLWALDCCPLDVGYIDFWSITLWYQDLPDLVITTITPSNINPTIDDTISVSMMIRNQGSKEAGFFYVGLYYNLSAPPDIFTLEDQAFPVGGLLPGDSQVITFHGVTSSDTGIWNMYGWIDCDGYVPEINDSNNYIGPRGVKWWGINPKPDLVVAEAWVSNSCNPTLDESVYVDVVIKNIGGSTATHGFGFYTDIFYNQDTVVPPASGKDWHLTYELKPESTETFTFVLQNPSIPETWKMWLLVDSDPQRITESNENNNLFGPIYIYWQAPVFRRGALTRTQIIENAMKFVNVSWICPAKNGERRSCDIEQDWTSDYTVGVEYVGEPYKWGGWDIPGDINNPKCFIYYVSNNLKRAGSHMENDCIEDPVGDPAWATGTDCSGLVSRAWDVFYVGPSGKRFKPGVYTLIDSFAIQLAHYDSLKRGDALISTDKQHTFVLKDWIAYDTIQVIEARSWGTGVYRDRSRVSDNYKWTIIDLNNDNYRPFKYEQVLEEWLVIPGDANSDGTVSVSDVVYLTNYLFKGGPPPNPLCKGDVNHDHRVSVSDVVYLINYLFKGGSPPSPLACPW